MCPKCGQPLVAFELNGIEIDHCIQCRGTWLDAGELEHIADFAGANRGAFGRALDAASGGNAGKRRCPRCRKRLQVVKIETGTGGIEIDRCRFGDGIWLDQGEMAWIIREFHDGEEGAVAAFFGELYKSEIGSEQKGDS